MIIERGETAQLSYDPSENILYVDFSSVMVFDTPEKIVAHFEFAVGFIRRHCLGRKIYCVVDLDGLEVHARYTAVYAAQLRRVYEHTITVVRFGGSSLQRATLRLANMKLKLHNTSSIYGSREEALFVIRSLKAGEMLVIPPP